MCCRIPSVAHEDDRATSGHVLDQDALCPQVLMHLYDAHREEMLDGYDEHGELSGLLDVGACHHLLDRGHIVCASNSKGWENR